MKSELQSKSIKIFNAIKTKGASSLRSLANKIDVPKSTICRHKLNQQKRIEIIGHDLYESKEGADTLTKLVVLVIFIFGIKAGVGGETIAIFFSAFLSNQYIAASPSQIRIMKAKMRKSIEGYGDKQMQVVLRLIKNCDLHLGADETFKSKLVYLVLADLPSGFIFYEELADNRTYETWIKHVGGFLDEFSDSIKSFTADGGSVLKKLAKFVGCVHFMDLFHGLKDLRDLFATKFHSKRQKLLKIIRGIQSKSELTEDQKLIEISDVEKKVDIINDSQALYRASTFEVSTQSHPYKNNLEQQSSIELQKNLDVTSSSLREMAVKCDIKDKKKLLNRFSNRTKGLSLINDKWHSWVDDSIGEMDEDPKAQEWAKRVLLPAMYWQEQLRKSSRDKRLRLHYKSEVKSADQALTDDPLTAELIDNDWRAYGYAMAVKYQRTTSAIEGRNAKLDEHCYNVRGARSEHTKAQTVLHNFWIQRSDHSTACSRLCGFDPPDLLEHLIAEADYIGMPRVTKKKAA